MKDKSVICYDLMIVPHGMELEKLFGIMKKTGILFYDTFEVNKMGHDSKPYMLDGSKASDKVFIDISTEEGKKIYDKVIKEMNNEV